MRLRPFVYALLLAGLTSAACAHDPGLSGLAIRTYGDHVEAIATFARNDIAGVLDAPPTRERLLELAPQILTIARRGEIRRPDRVEVDPHAKNNDVEFRFLFPPGAPGETWTLNSSFIERLAPGHRQYLSVADAAGHLQLEKLLRAGASSIEIETRSPSRATFFGFLQMGIEHILTGYDHLLFLAALLLVCRNFASSLKIISCFTLGHSITLALATLNVVNLSGRIVEPLIAASIIYVGVENLIRRGEPRGRYVLTFAFGLVHGLGFASALREMGVGSDGEGVLLPLLGFNLGVELGQLSVAAVVLPVFALLRSNPLWVTRWIPVASVLVALAGAYWLIERVTGLGG